MHDNSGMAVEKFLYLGVLGSTILITIGLAIFGAVRHRTSGALPFCGIMVAALFYSLGSFFEIQATTVDQIHLWISVEYLGIATIGPFWLLTAWGMTGHRDGPSNPFWLLLFVLPLAIEIVLVTNDSHGLFYTSIAVGSNGPFTVPILGKGPWYWVNMVYMNACLLTGGVICLQRVIRAAPVFRIQGLLMFTGSLMPWTGMLVYQLHLSPYGLDMAPLGLTVAGLIYAWGLFRFGLLDLTPIVHENVFTAMSDGVLVVDLKGRLTGVNPACQAILPELNPHQIGEPASGLLTARPGLLSMLGHPDAHVKDLELDVGGVIRHFEAGTMPLKDRHGRRVGTILNLSDISARVALLAELERMAATDSLTGLQNRRAFMVHAMREMERARRKAGPVSLILFDLDHFKAINDRYGHQAGDAVLCRAALLCQNLLRQTDLAARYGGEEFLILLPDTNLEAALLVAERLRAMLAAERFEFNGIILGCPASLGISHRDSPLPEDLEPLITEADMAMYAAKAAGRNAVRCYGET